MTKEKLSRLNRYLDNLNNRKNSPIPPKHKNHPKEFIQFLDREIEMVVSKIEEAKLGKTSDKI